MKKRVRTVLAWCLFSCVLAFAQGQGQPQLRQPITNAVAPDIPGVVAGGTKIQLIKWGFQAVEGAIAGPDGSLIFCEPNAERLLKIDKDDNISVFLEKTGRSIGLAWDARGRLIGAETRPPLQTKVAVLYPKGSEAVLAESFDGKPLASPNDVVADKKGGIYFTDLGPNPFQPRSEESGLPPSVYYINPSGKVMRVVENLPGANGIILSPDEKTLYVNNRSEYIVAFDVQQDGTVTNRRNHAKYDGSMGGDGLTIDSQGRLYTASGGRVQIFDPKGQYLGSLPLPTTNLAFAGPDKKTLYMVGGSAGGLGLVDGAAYKVRMLTEGFKGRAK